VPAQALARAEAAYHRDAETARHLDRLGEELGPRPTGPDDLAFWAAALLNPVAGAGVAQLAREIRPEVLTAPSAAERLAVVEGELEASIARLRQAEPDRDPRTETQSKEDE
jgi:hypothetical protein